MSLPVIDDLESLFLRGTALLDVRAPVEFAQGAFPGSVNLPLLNDEERHQVGLCYKTRGQDAAIELGNRLVAGETRRQRIDAWYQHLKQRDDVALYCFRGGLRSRITQQWLYEQTGERFPLVKGGYKAMRQFLLATLERHTAEMPCLLLSGRTGSGKTRLLQTLAHKIDLEGLYHHRGSVFGRHVDDQPGQIDIENALAIELLKQQRQGRPTLVLEDEGVCIGGRRIPECLFQRMKQAPVIVLEVDFAQRVDIIFDEYVVQSCAEYQRALGAENGRQGWADGLLLSIDKIRKRLGGKAHGEIRALMLDALNAPPGHDDLSRHKQWIARLLQDYYDPMYDYQLSKKAQRIVFRGDWQAVQAFIGEHAGF